MSYPSSLQAASQVDWILREAHSARDFQKLSNTQVRFQFDPTSGQLSAEIIEGETHHRVPREAIRGIPDALSLLQVQQFVRHAVCLCTEEKNQLTLEDPKRYFIEQLTFEKIKELESSSTSLDEDIQSQNGSQFIYEFIQNACDAANPERELDVSFVLHNEVLVISHSGKHFDETDIKTISTNKMKGNRKRKESSCIGYKGVGFKSIFNHSSCFIFSIYS